MIEYFVGAPQMRAGDDLLRQDMDRSALSKDFHPLYSDKRQREAIRSFARREGFALVAEFYDPGVSGADPIKTRPGFSALLDRIEGNGGAGGDRGGCLPLRP